MLVLPAPPPAQWEGVTTAAMPGGKTRFTLKPGMSFLRITVDNLVPAHRLTVRIRVRADRAGQFIVLRIGNHAARFGPGPTYVHSAVMSDAGTTLAIEVTGLHTGIIEELSIWDATQLPENPRPCDVLSLQAYYPLPGFFGLRWNNDRWNRASWSQGGARPWAMRWNHNSWDTRAWNQGESITSIWQDITGPCTDISVTRGVQATGAAMSATVGTLSARAINALSPRATGIHHGTPLRLVHWPTRSLIFTGVITDLTINPKKPGSRIDYEVTFTASDNVARLAGVTRYGAKADGGDGSESWAARLERLMKSAPELAYQVHDNATQTVAPVVWETSLARHLDALMSSVVGTWNVERDGTISIRTRRPRTPTLTLTDAEASNLRERIWSYTDINVAWASTDTLAHVTLSNHGARFDTERGEWEAADLDTTVSDPTAANAWGGASISIDTTLPTRDIDRVARRYLSAANGEPAPSSVSLTAAHETGPADRDAHMAAAATLDPITAVAVEWRGEDTTALITQVAHVITPTTWKTALTLTNNKQ